MKPSLELIEYNDGQSIKVFQFACDAFQETHDWHFHPEYEIAVILKGRGTRLMGDSIELFEQGDVTLVGPNLPHCWVSHDGETDNEMLVVQFKAESFHTVLSSTPEMQDLHSLLERSSKGVLCRFEYFDPIANMLNKLVQSNGLNRLAHLMMFFDALLVESEQRTLSHSGFGIGRYEAHHDRLTTVLIYLHSNLASDIKQSDVAELTNLGPQSFSRFFKEATGRTFISFLNGLRIAEACRLLIYSDSDITHISLECGYRSLSHFNKQFLDIKGCTPSHYRRMHTMER